MTFNVSKKQAKMLCETLADAAVTGNPILFFDTDPANRLNAVS